MAGKFDLKKSPSGRFMHNLKAANSRVIFTSELYDTKAATQKRHRVGQEERAGCPGCR